jgi:hypothetical protein
MARSGYYQNKRIQGKQEPSASLISVMLLPTDFKPHKSGLRVGGYMNASLASWTLTQQFSKILELGLILNFEGSKKSKNWGKETLTLIG